MGSAFHGYRSNTPLFWSIRIHTNSNSNTRCPPKDKKAKKSGSNIFSLFSQKQIQEFKEAFGIIDNDKDGIITAPDLKKAFEGIGRPISDGEANNMVGEAPGPINFTQMVTLFAEKMSGGTDDDDVIVRSFEAFEINGQIDAEMVRHSLMTWGEKFSSNEIDDAFREFKIDGGMIDAEHLKSIMVAKKMTRNKSLSPRISPSRKKPSMGLFLDSQETLLVIKYPFRKAGTNISKQPTARGKAKKSPKKILCIKKKYQNQSLKKQHQGHLNMRIDQEKLSQCCKIVK